MKIDHEWLVNGEWVMSFCKLWRSWGPQHPPLLSTSDKTRCKTQQGFSSRRGLAVLRDRKAEIGYKDTTVHDTTALHARSTVALFKHEQFQAQLSDMYTLHSSERQWINLFTFYTLPVKLLHSPCTQNIQRTREGLDSVDAKSAASHPFPLWFPKIPSQQIITGSTS